MRFLPGRQEKPGDENRKTSERIENAPEEGDIEKKEGGENGTFRGTLPPSGREKERENPGRG